MATWWLAHYQGISKENGFQEADGVTILEVSGPGGPAYFKSKNRAIKRAIKLVSRNVSCAQREVDKYTKILYKLRSLEVK